MPTSLLDRARTVVRHAEPPHSDGRREREISERSERRPATATADEGDPFLGAGPARAATVVAGPVPPNPETGLAPLDGAIAADEAGKRSAEDIRRRLARCEDFAAQPGASGIDRQAVDDWRRILAAKTGEAA